MADRQERIGSDDVLDTSASPGCRLRTPRASAGGVRDRTGPEPTGTRWVHAEPAGRGLRRARVVTKGAAEPQVRLPTPSPPGSPSGGGPEFESPHPTSPLDARAAITWRVRQLSASAPPATLGTQSPCPIVEQGYEAAPRRQHATRSAARAGRLGARRLHPSSPHRPGSGTADPTNHPIISTTSRLESRGLPRDQLPCPSHLAGPGWPQVPVPGDRAGVARAGRGAWPFQRAGTLPDDPAWSPAAVGR